MTYINDLHNARFGRLVAKEYVGNSKWKCICDCGNEIVVRTSKLTSGNTKSCKCYRNTLLAKERTLGSGYASFREVLRSYIRTAQSRNLSFRLDESTCYEMMQKDCYYCGSSPSSIKKHRECFGDFIYNGIDRVDSSKGYIKGNVVTCCKTCNYAKHTMSTQEFREWINKIFSHKEKVNW